MASFESYIRDTNVEQTSGKILTNVCGQALQLTKYPHQKNQPITLVEQNHSCIGSFTLALKRFINDLSSNSLTRQQLQQNLLPITHINVYHSFKLLPPALHEDTIEQEIIKATPSRKEGSISRFDTVVVVDKIEEAESTGLQGTFNSYYLLHS